MVQRFIAFLALLAAFIAGPTAWAQNQGCSTTSIAVTATGYTLLASNPTGQVMSVQAGYYTSGSPASVSAVMSYGFVPNGVATPLDTGGAATNTTAADVGNVTGQYPFFYLHTSTLSTGGTLNVTVCVSNNVSKNAPLSSVGSNIVIKGGGAGTPSSMTDNGTTVSSAESLTFTGGIVANSTKWHILSPDPGSAAYTGINTNGTNYSATVMNCTEVFLPSNKAITGIAVLNGTTVTSTSVRVGLYSATGGAVLATSVAGGTATANASVYQQRDFTAPYAAVGPATYFACLQANNATDTVRLVVTGAGDNVLTSGPTTTFDTFPSFTPPTTFTSAKGAWVYLY